MQPYDDVVRLITRLQLLNVTEPERQEVRIELLRKLTTIPFFLLAGGQQRD